MPRKKKKTYFVCSDIHSFFDPFFTALLNAGFDYYNPSHYLIICGDLFDRGPDSQRLLNFLLEFSQLGRLILIKGNHESLMEGLLQDLKKYNHIGSHHWTNGTIDTIVQLTGVEENSILKGEYDYNFIKEKLEDYFKLVSQCVNFFEVGNYIFVHAGLPIVWHDEFPDEPGMLGAWMIPEIPKGWRQSSEYVWENARWQKSIYSYKDKIFLEGKVIVFGHWHTSAFWAHKYPEKYTEFGEKAEFGIFKDIDRETNTGIIAIDACTAYSKKVNILIIEE